MRMQFELFQTQKKKTVGFIHDTRPKDDDFNLLQKLTFERSTSFIIAPTLEIYKKNLLIKLMYSFILFLLFIFERTFHQTIQAQELNLILNLQKLWFGNKLLSQVEGSFFYFFFGKIGEFHFSFLLMTHFIVTLYVAVDAMIALKTMTVTIFSVFTLSMFSFLNAEARPYWTSSKIKAFYCDATYSDPGVVTFLFLFLIVYCYRCFGQKEEELLATAPFDTSFDEDESVGIFNEKQKLWLNRAFLGVSLLIFGFALFLRFLIGLEYLTNYFLSFIIFAIIYGLVLTTDSFIEDVIKQTTILKLYAKQKVFNWLVFVFILQCIAFVVYQQTDYKTELLYFQNYFKCQSHNNQQVQTQKLYYEVLGKKETFQATSVVFALIGLVFGASQTFRAITSINWYKGPLKLRLLRALIANLAMVPSWFLIIFQQEIVNTASDHFMGLSNFMIDSIHYFLLYYGLFGVIPVYIYLYFGITFMDLRFSMVISH